MKKNYNQKATSGLLMMREPRLVNQPGYQKGAMGMVNLIVDVMNDTHEYKEAMFCKHLLMECSRKHHLDLEEQIERVVAQCSGHR